MLLFSSLRKPLRAFSNAMLKNTPDIDSPYGDLLLASNDSVRSFPKRNVVDVSLKRNRHILISSSFSIGSSIGNNSSVSILWKAYDISIPDICTSVF